MANQTYYFNRVFSELFDIQVRLMELEGMQGLDYQNGEPFDIQVRLMELENMQGLDYQLYLMHLDTSRKTWKKFCQSLNLIRICLYIGFLCCKLDIFNMN